MRRSTRLATTLLACITMLTACSSSNSGEPAPTGATGPASSSAFRSDPPSSSNTSPSTSVRPTPSVIDPSSLITPNPWPATLTPEQVTEAQAAIEGYRDYWKMVDVAIAQPTQDWTEQVQQHTDGPAQVALMETLGRLVERGRYASGTTSVNPVVVDVQPGLVVISDCVDKTATDILDPTVPANPLEHRTPRERTFDTRPART